MFICWSALGALAMLVSKALKLPWVESIPLRYHGACARLCGIRVICEGTPSTHKPTLFVSNHASYMDVFVLGSVIKAQFVAKSEVASWPLLGKLAKLQNTLFLERRAVRAADQIAQVRTELDGGKSLILFPEGTSTSGNWVAPFRSSLFAAADDHWVQPVTVVYATYEGRPMNAADRDQYAWYLPNPKTAPTTPNAPFAKHFFSGLGLRGEACVKLLFHPPLLMPAGSRKETAKQCETTVRSALERCLDVERS